MSTTPSLTCKQLVELVSDYIEGALSPGLRDAFEQHIAGCDGCDRYVAQMRLTIAMLGKLTEDSIEPGARDRLLDVFRDWKGQQPLPAPP
jgi:anti-sigma factor RsiW